MSAWTFIAHTELSSTTSVTFTSIAGTYTDLCLLLSARGSQDDTLSILFNGSDANFTGRLLQGNGSSTASFARTDTFAGYVSTTTDTSNTFGNAMIYIPNYSGSTNKSFSIDAVSENNATGADQSIYAGLWSQSAAITSITLRNLGAQGFLQFSSATLYGILKGSSGGVSVS